MLGSVLNSTFLGASTGIGRSTAELFAKRGAKVAITGRNAESLEVKN